MAIAAGHRQRHRNLERAEQSENASVARQQPAGAELEPAEPVAFVRIGAGEIEGESERLRTVLAEEHGERSFGLAFYLAGADPHEGDRLGRLKLSAGGLLERDRRVLARLGALRIPVALAMAGGYGHDLDVTVAIQAATIAAAIDAWHAWRHHRSRAGDAAAAAPSAQPALAIDNRGP